MTLRPFSMHTYQQRFPGSRGLITFVMGLVIIAATLVLLPLLLLMAALGFVLFSLISHLLLALHQKKSKQRYQFSANQYERTTEHQENTKGQYQGRVFEHEPPKD